jgi:hypothetical protein
MIIPRELGQSAVHRSCTSIITSTPAHWDDVYVFDEWDSAHGACIWLQMHGVWEQCKHQLQGGYGLFSVEVDEADRRDKLTGYLQDIIHAMEIAREV